MKHTTAGNVLRTHLSLLRHRPVFLPQTLFWFWVTKNKMRLESAFGSVFGYNHPQFTMFKYFVFVDCAGTYAVINCESRQ